MMWGYGISWLGMLLMLLCMVLGVAILGGLLWAALRWMSDRRPLHSDEGLSATEILRQRYARGEIDSATFEQMRARMTIDIPGTVGNRQLAPPMRD